MLLEQRYQKTSGYFQALVKKKVKGKILQWEKIANINHMFVMSVSIAF